MRRSARLLALLALALAAAPAAATDFAPKTDNGIVALDLATGKVRWRHVPARLSDAHFELYPEGLVAFPHYSQADRTAPIFLDTRTGAPITPFAPDARRLRARSVTFSPNPAVTLANGWVLSGFSPGNTKTLSFTDPAGKVVWEVRAPEYPEFVLGHGDLVLYAYGYLTGQARIHAQAAGRAAPSWSLDINEYLRRHAIAAQPPSPSDRRSAADRRSRVRPQIIDGVLYAQANEHLLAIDPATGAVGWHLDLARATGARFVPDFFGGALDLAAFAKDGDVLVVAYERRVLGVDTKRRKVLWHVVPDTFPHCPFPAAAGGVVYLTAGARLGAP